MVSLDPDDFLADLADNPDYPSRPFPATENLAEEEELEWLSNKDLFPAVETCMLTEEPPKKAMANAEQGNPVSVSVVKASIGGCGAVLLSPMPSRKTKDESAKVKSMRVCTYCGVTQTPQWPEGALGICNACGFSYKTGRLCPEDSPKVQSIKSEKVKSFKSDSVNGIKSDKVKNIKRKCTHCGITQTPQWRLGPLGLQSLCNACGVRYKSGRLCPEYRPANSPTFLQELHSNKHRKVMEIRKQIYGNEGTVVRPVDKCTNSAAATALEKMKKDMFPTVATVEQPRRSVIAEQQSPVSVLENSTNNSTTLEPHQPPSKFLRQQLFCNQPNNKHNQEDTAKVEIESNIILMNSCVTLELPYKAPSEVLGQQQLFSCQPTSKRRKKNTVEMKNEGNNATLTSSCGNLEPPHQAPSQFLERHQLFYDQPNNKCNKKHTAKVEMTMKPVDICTTLMKSKKDSLPAVQTLNILEHSRGIFIAEQQSPVVGIEVNCQNCGAEQSPQWWEGPLGPKTVCLSCGLAKYTGRRKRSMSLASKKKHKKEDIAKVEMAVKPGDKCTNSTTALMNSKKDPLPAVGTSNISEQPSVIVIAEQQSPASVFENSTSSSMMLMSSSGTVNPHNQAASEFPQQNQFCDQANNKPKEKDTTTVEIEGNSSTLMRSSGALEPLHQAPNEFLDQQQQAKNKPNKKDTAKVESEGNSTTLMSSCGTTKPPHQAQSEFLGQQQLFCNQANNGTKKENTAKGESEGKCQNCGAEQSPHWLGGPLGPKTLCHACGLAKCTASRQRSIAVEVGKLPCPSPATGEFTNSTCTFPVLEEFHLLQKPSDIANAEQQKPFSVLESSTNNSIALMSSCRIKIPHRARSKVLRRRRSTIPGQQVGIGKNCMQCGKQTNRWRMGPLGPTTLCNACGNKYQPLWGRSGLTVDIAKNCQHCGSEETTQLLLCPLGPKTLCTSCCHWFKASAEVEIGRKCQHCGVEKTPLWRSGPLGSKTLCNACGLRWYKFGDLCRDHPASSPTLLRELDSNYYRKVLI
ncbi:hypothetical protein ABKV19_025611 [Rosa sericea]